MEVLGFCATEGRIGSVTNKLLTRWFGGGTSQVEASCSMVVFGPLESEQGRSVRDSVRDDGCGISVVEERIGSVTGVPLTRWFEGGSSQVKAAHRTMVLGSLEGGLGRSVSDSRWFEAVRLAVCRRAGRVRRWRDPSQEGARRRQLTGPASRRKVVFGPLGSGLGRLVGTRLVGMCAVVVFVSELRTFVERVAERGWSGQLAFTSVDLCRPHDQFDVEFCRVRDDLGDAPGRKRVRCSLMVTSLGR